MDMPKHLKKRFAAIAAAFVIGSSPPTMAGGATGGATEITQIINSIELIIQTVTQYMEYYTQIEQYATQLQQLEGADLGAFNSYKSNSLQLLSDARNAYNAANQFYGSVNEVKSLAQSRYQEFAASGLTWEGWVSRQSEISGRYEQTGHIMTDHEVYAMKKVQRNWDDLQRISQDVPQSEGTHAAMQMMNGQMSMLNGTFNDMLSLQAAQSRRETERNMLDDAQKKYETVEGQRIKIQQSAGSEADKKLREFLLSK